MLLKKKNLGDDNKKIMISQEEFKEFMEESQRDNKTPETSNRTNEGLNESNISGSEIINSVSKV